MATQLRAEVSSKVPRRRKREKDEMQYGERQLLSERMGRNGRMKVLIKLDESLTHHVGPSTQSTDVAIICISCDIRVNGSVVIATRPLKSNLISSFPRTKRITHRLPAESAVRSRITLERRRRPVRAREERHIRRGLKAAPVKTVTNERGHKSRRLSR